MDYIYDFIFPVFFLCKVSERNSVKARDICLKLLKWTSETIIIECIKFTRWLLLLVLAFAAISTRQPRAKIASTAVLDYRPQMHARHGQGAAAAQATPPRSKLSDLLHLWVNNFRLLYSWSALDNTPQLSSTMGNLHSDSKKKQKKKDSAAVTASSEDLDTLVEDQKKDKGDQLPKIPDSRNESEVTRINFGKMQLPGHAKRQAPQPPQTPGRTKGQAPQPPKVVLTEVLLLFFFYD